MSPERFRALEIKFPEVPKLLFLRVGLEIVDFWGRSGHLPFQKPISAGGGLRPRPALMGCEEEDGRFDPKNRRFQARLSEIKVCRPLGKPPVAARTRALGQLNRSPKLTCSHVHASPIPGQGVRGAPPTPIEDVMPRNPKSLIFISRA